MLEGLPIAFLNLDEVIRIIRASDEPRPEPIKAVKLSDRQAEAILRFRLRQLACLEEQKYKTERKELSAEKEEIEMILASTVRLRNHIKKELAEDAKRFGDARRTRIVMRGEAWAISKTELAPVEAVTVVLSKMGWVRTAKGHDIQPAELIYKAGDEFLCADKGRSNQPAIFMDSTGRTFAADPNSFPTARSYGAPLTGSFSIDARSHFIAVLMGEPDQPLLIASAAGYGFVSARQEIYSRNTKGKTFLSLPPGARPLSPIPINANRENMQLMAITQQGRMLVLAVSDCPACPKAIESSIFSAKI